MEPRLQRIGTQHLCIVVLGYVVRGPLGGMVWSNLQYLMGLRELGHEVWFVEDSDDYPGCYDPSTHEVGVDPRYGLEFATKVFARIGQSPRWAYHDAHRRAWYGPGADRMPTVLKQADLLLDLCGVNPMRPWLCEIPVRVLVDEDPGFTQIRHLVDAAARERALAHNAFFTFAHNFGRPGCTVPDDGLPWRPTRQPLKADGVEPSRALPGAVYTTVMQWDSYPTREFEGRRYGMKSEAFEPYLRLPSRVPVALELALGGAGAPRAMLRAHGWRVADALRPTLDPWTYLDYLAASRAEFSVAKLGYVSTRSGWFSERSVAYMAHARPVILQDTGFSDWLCCGEGVLAFSSPDEAVAAIADVESRYDLHARRAREVAIEFFDAGRVLGRLIDDAFATASMPAGRRAGAAL